MSIVCGTNRIAWAHVDRGMIVLDWQQMECPNFLKGTYLASSYLTDVCIPKHKQMHNVTVWHMIDLDGYFFKQVSAVVEVIPAADFYIIEKTSLSIQNINLFPIMAHMRTVEAMLFSLLEPRVPQPEPNIPPR